jgi:hypothetical protein
VRAEEDVVDAQGEARQDEDTRRHYALRFISIEIFRRKTGTGRDTYNTHEEVRRPVVVQLVLEQGHFGVEQYGVRPREFCERDRVRGVGRVSGRPCPGSRRFGVGVGNR